MDGIRVSFNLPGTHESTTEIDPRPSHRPVDHNEVAMYPPGSGLASSPPDMLLTLEHPGRVDSFEASEASTLLRSFDMIFQLHQRSEELHALFERIDTILLKSRTVAALMDSVTRVLRREFDLVAVRILLRDDHPISSIARRTDCSGVGFIPGDLLEHETLIGSDPFVLDNPHGDLCFSLFADSAHQVASAVIATLSIADNDLGLLCLGSDDPHRYCGAMNTQLIATLVDKISLGIMNAWDHESKVTDALSPVDGVYTSLFFHEFLHKEFNRAWRSQTPFCLLALCWTCLPDGETPSRYEMAELVSRNLRSADLVAVSDTVKLWVLLPDTHMARGQSVARRICRLYREYFDDRSAVHIGLTQFSRNATVPAMLLNHARQALDHAMLSDNHSIVVKVVPLPPKPSCPE